MARRSIVPYTKVVTLRYAESVTLLDSGVANQCTSHIFRLTSGYDPDYTAVGHQPLGYDQWAAFYEECCVESVTYDIAPALDEAAKSRVFAVWITPTIPSALTAITNILEQPASKYMVLLAGTSGAVTKSIRSTFKTKNLFGFDDLKDRDDMWSQVGQLPTAEYYLCVSACSFRASQTESVHAIVNLKMRVRFRKPRHLSQS